MEMQYFGIFCFFVEKENKLLLAKAGTDNTVSVMELHGI